MLLWFINHICGVHILGVPNCISLQTNIYSRNIATKLFTYLTFNIFLLIICHGFSVVSFKRNYLPSVS